jgi:hypothetical protein
MLDPVALSLLFRAAPWLVGGYLATHRLARWSLLLVLPNQAYDALNNLQTNT